MSDRVPVSQKLRFEVFKRDSFTCQYCGRKSPEVVLECDHIDPVSAGGPSEVINLITSCADCNRGKSDRKLSDDAVIQKQRGQLEELNARRQQMEMMAQWRAELVKLDDHATALAEEAWLRAIESQYVLTDGGRDRLSKWVKRHGLEMVFQGIAGAAKSYLSRDNEGKFLSESVEYAFDMIPRVISVLKQSENKPYLQQLFYARGILRRRLSYVKERIVIGMMEEAIEYGASVDEIMELCKRVRNWSEFRRAINEFIEGEQEARRGERHGSDS